MNEETIKIHIEAALDLVQLVSEDVETNFIDSDLGHMISARASITVSALHILSDYLRGIAEGLDIE